MNTPLHRQIAGLITKYGGRTKCCNAIMNESKEWFGTPYNGGRISRVSQVRDYAPRYTPDEDKVIIDNWETKSLNEIGQMIDRHFSSVCRRGYKIGLTPKLYSRTGWTHWKHNI